MPLPFPSPLPNSPKQNHLLAALNAKEYVRLVDDLELVALERGQILYDAGDIPDYVYVPTTAMFNRFIEQVLGNKGKVRCEIARLPTAQRAEAMVRIEAVTDESGHECRMVVIDVSPEKQAEQALFIATSTSARCSTTSRSTSGSRTSKAAFWPSMPPWPGTSADPRPTPWSASRISTLLHHNWPKPIAPRIERC